MAPKNQELEPIKDKKITERYIRYTVEFREPISCFIESTSIRFEANAKSFDSGLSSLELEIDPDSFQNISADDLKKLDQMPKDLRLSFTVNEALFFIHALVESRKVRRLNVTIDTPIYKLQRREAVRIKVLDAHKASIQVEGKSYVPHDISASGISFVVMIHELPLFPKGKTFPSCKLNFLDIDVPVILEVMGSSPLKKGSEHLWKVGFRFRHLPAAVEQRLAREAYLYTHKIWSRWL